MRKRKTIKKKTLKPVVKRRISPKKAVMNEYQLAADVIASGYRNGTGADENEEAKRKGAAQTATLVVEALSEAITLEEAKGLIKTFKAALPQEYDWRIMEGRRIAVEAIAGLFV